MADGSPEAGATNLHAPNNSEDSPPSPSQSASKSPPPPLAPLDYLQSQRRGSITDPSLHAATTSVSSPPRQEIDTNCDELRPSDLGSTPGSVSLLSNSQNMTCASPAGTRSQENAATLTNAGPAAVQSRVRVTSDNTAGTLSASGDQQPTLQQGTKRKMSNEPTSNKEGNDLTLIGGGPEPVNASDAEGPAHKRHNSTVDAARISPNPDERQGAVDVRGGWAWPPDRAPIFPHLPPGYPPGPYAHDPNRPLPNLASFVWPPVSHPGAPHAIPPHLAAPMVSAYPFPVRPVGPPTSPPLPMHPLPVLDNASASTGSRPSKDQASTPYARSPELRVSHKLAERKRRKEMKDLFDELRDLLPADRGMKSSKWEILSKAIDFVAQLKQSHQDMSREIEMLRNELDSVRHGGTAFAAGGSQHLPAFQQGAMAGPSGHYAPTADAGPTNPSPPIPPLLPQHSGILVSNAQASVPGDIQPGGGDAGATPAAPPSGGAATIVHVVPRASTPTIPNTISMPQQAHTSVSPPASTHSAPRPTNGLGAAMETSAAPNSS